MSLSSVIKTVYLNALIVVYALYAYFNKGVAYSFAVEAMLAIGLISLVFNLGDFIFFKSKPVIILLFFIFVTVVSFSFNISKYPIYPLIQDGAMFFYGGFVFIVFLLSDKIDVLVRGLSYVYAFYPVVAFLNFLILSYVPNAGEFILFGKTPLLLYKYGDMAVHLLIATLLMLCGYIKMNKKMLVINVLLIVYLFLVIAAYNRAGMVAYLVGLGTFLLTYRKRFSVNSILSYFRFTPLVLAIVLLAYINTNVEENFQGRTVGLEQLKQNIVSIFSTEIDGSLNKNKIWRIAWWLQIISDASEPMNALIGRGLGVNLAQIGDIPVEDESLRSPHNFHLNVLARFGLPVFLLWCFWMGIHLRRISAKNPEFSVMILVILLTFLINATFDVYLEGPMGAMPFWIWLGILYVQDAYLKENLVSEAAVI